MDQTLGVWRTVPTVTTEWILPIAQRSRRQGDTPPMSARGELSRERGSPLTLFSVISKLEYLDIYIYIIDYIIINISIYILLTITLYIYIYVYMRAIAKAREQVTSRVCAHKRGHCICPDV